MSFFILWTSGDILGDSASDYDTVEHAQLLCVLDTYATNTPGEDPARRTIPLNNIAALGGKIYAVNSSSGRRHGSGTFGDTARRGGLTRDARCSCAGSSSATLRCATSAMVSFARRSCWPSVIGSAVAGGGSRSIVAHMTSGQGRQSGSRQEARRRRSCMCHTTSRTQWKWRAIFAHAVLHTARLSLCSRVRSMRVRAGCLGRVVLVDSVNALVAMNPQEQTR
jgi:hypothetical protein